MQTIFFFDDRIVPFCLFCLLLWHDQFFCLKLVFVLPSGLTRKFSRTYIYISSRKNKTFVNYYYIRHKANGNDIGIDAVVPTSEKKKVNDDLVEGFASGRGTNDLRECEGEKRRRGINKKKFVSLHVNFLTTKNKQKVVDVI